MSHNSVIADIYRPTLQLSNDSPNGYNLLADALSHNSNSLEASPHSGALPLWAPLSVSDDGSEPLLSIDDLLMDEPTQLGSGHASPPRLTEIKSEQSGLRLELNEEQSTSENTPQATDIKAKTDLLENGELFYPAPVHSADGESDASSGLTLACTDPIGDLNSDSGFDSAFVDSKSIHTAARPSPTVSTLTSTPAQVRDSIDSLVTEAGGDLPGDSRVLGFSSQLDEQRFALENISPQAAKYATEMDPASGEPFEDPIPIQTPAPACIGEQSEAPTRSRLTPKDLDSESTKTSDRQGNEWTAETDPVNGEPSEGQIPIQVPCGDDQSEASSGLTLVYSDPTGDLNSTDTAARGSPVVSIATSTTQLQELIDSLATGGISQPEGTAVSPSDVSQNASQLEETARLSPTAQIYDPTTEDTSPQPSALEIAPETAVEQTPPTAAPGASNSTPDRQARENQADAVAPAAARASIPSPYNVFIVQSARDAPSTPAFASLAPVPDSEPDRQDGGGGASPLYSVFRLGSLTSRRSRPYTRRGAGPSMGGTSGAGKDGRRRKMLKFDGVVITRRPPGARGTDEGKATGKATGGGIAGDEGEPSVVAGSEKDSSEDDETRAEGSPSADDDDDDNDDTAENGPDSSPHALTLAAALSSAFAHNSAPAERPASRPIPERAAPPVQDVRQAARGRRAGRVDEVERWMGENVAGGGMLVRDEEVEAEELVASTRFLRAEVGLGGRVNGYAGVRAGYAYAAKAPAEVYIDLVRALFGEGSGVGMPGLKRKPAPIESEHESVSDTEAVDVTRSSPETVEASDPSTPVDALLPHKGSLKRARSYTLDDGSRRTRQRVDEEAVREWVNALQRLVKGKMQIEEQDMRELGDTLDALGRAKGTMRTELKVDIEQTVRQLAELGAEEIPFGDPEKLRERARGLCAIWSTGKK